jgi:hypothetical protein
MTMFVMRKQETEASALISREANLATVQQVDAADMEMTPVLMRERAPRGRGLLVED